MGGHHEAREQLRGIGLLVISASLFGAVDGLSKILADTQSVGQIVWARYALALPVLIATARPADWRGLFRTGRPTLHVVRGLTPLMISGMMVLAVRFLPLADATVVFFAGPFLVIPLSVFFLGERVRAASWIGVIIGFTGVLVVARPGFSQLSHYTVFPLVAAVFNALFQLLTRKLGSMGERPNTTLAWSLSIGCLASTPFAALTWAPVTATTWLLMITLGVVFGFAQLLLIRAFSYAPASVLAPFSFAQIIAATIFGIVIFQDVPDLWTGLGILMIMGAGFYVMRSPAT